MPPGFSVVETEPIIADRTPAALNVTSLFLTPRTFSARSGHVMRPLALAPQFTGSRAALALLHLAEFQLDRRGAAENRYHDLEPGARFIDLLDNTIEGREGTIRDTDCSPTSKETDGFAACHSHLRT
jgi:hypothetical protein